MAHILVVDDEHDVVTLIKFLLEKNGYKVSSAHNGAEALKFLGAEAGSSRPDGELPDVIILDLMMPILDGPGFARRINGIERLSAIPMIILSAKGQVQRFFEMPNRKTMYLGKPFDPKKLRGMVMEILGEEAQE